ncbi:MAG: LCP family protein [Lachnospiraceae bacterium]|nr:LCP family protein [Lachnospiraceae bacterium]
MSEKNTEPQRKKPKKKRKKRSKVMSILITVFLLLAILAMVGVIFYFIILPNRYSGLLNYVYEDETMAPDATLPPEDGDELETGSDSPLEVVSNIDDLLNQLQNATTDDNGNLVIPGTTIEPGTQVDPGTPTDPGATQSPGDSGNPTQPTQSGKTTQQVVLPAVQTSDDVKNILLIGIDARGDSNAGRSDTMIILSINDKAKTITMTSLLRDCYVAIPGRGNNRLNAAHAYGGAALLMQTIELNFGIHIDGFARVNFVSFPQIIDNIGGVTVGIEENEIQYINRYLKEINRIFGVDPNDSHYPEGQVGAQLLNGRQALAYSRIRYVGSDYARTQRQREVLNAVASKLRGMGVFEIDSFLNNTLPLISTNLDRGYVNSLITSAPSLLKYTIKEARIPADGMGTGVRIDGKSVISVDLVAARNYLNSVIYGR